MAKRLAKISEDKDIPVLFLGEALLLNQINQLASELLSCLTPSGGEVLLDGSRTETISTAAAQLLVAFEQHLQAHGTTLRLRHATPAFCQSMQRLGLGDYLARWMPA